ncbi:carbohydrate-binding protein [Acinetobacter towneri]|uniref:Carbohydrate-binding protein n=1 Tax=Acinetobacter towneri TaxID=202956 RepID=A0ABX7TGA1_9GAMM|nr:carbohydrate-binding protein [Acinetobacter towneri]QTD58738.1 carbohydrate-binding protein [Acinetobacter towneri]QTD62742.1 carbohydrate-binding protein [Acinetobacter towneri]
MKQWILKNNLSSGELSPLLWTRTDVQQYANGAKKLLNALPLVEGGAKKRPGTRFRGLFTGALRLIPFIANSESPYLLILGIGTLKVYNPRTKSIVWETETPYNTAQKVREIQFAHTRYRMYFVQGDVPVHRFITSANFDTWQFTPFVFSVQPNDEIGTSPNVALTPSGTDVGKVINLTAAAFPAWTSAESYIIGERVIYSGQTWRAVVDNTNSAPTVSNPDWESVTAGDASVFTSEHVGAVVAINSGQVKITSITSPAVAVGEVLVKLSSTVQAIAKSWTLNSLAFSAATGYPRSVVFFKQRLVFANTKNSPNQMWFSSIGNDGDFLESTDDADAFSIASSSAQSDNILHLAQRGGVVAFTGGSEFLISSTGALTPASAQIDQHTSYGVQKDVRPCMVGSEMLFVQRGGERLRALSYRFEVDGLVSPELSAVAPHIAEQHGGIKEITYQQTPNSVVWMVLGDGKMASITLNRDQEMNAWAMHDFGCNVISVCALPTATGADLCFMLTDRNGSLFLEEMLEDARSDCEFEIFAGTTTPPALASKLINPMSSWSNFDGCFYSEDFAPIEANYFYGQPFETSIELLPPDFSDAPATMMFHKATVHSAVVWLKDSIGGFVNDYELQHKRNDQNAFQNKPFTGYVEETLSGWHPLHQLDLKITHNKPLPFHVQSVSMLVSINER